MKIEDINGLIRDKIALQAPVICEDEAKKIFKSFNLPVVEDLKVTSPEEAKEAAKKMRFPVVLKGIGSKILHKTELGMVQLGLATPDQVYDSACKMKEKAKEKLEALLIQPQLKGEREFVAGMFKDDQFGPVIMFGLGGIFTEALNDTVFKIAPLSDADMEDMFDQLASKKLLNDFRGDKAVDKKEMKKILKGLSDLSCQVPHIREIDINPLMITPEGKPVAVDGLIILEPETRRKTKQYDIDKVALGACFYPESIAFVGASSTIGKWGHMLLTNTLSRDFKGRVYLVNPKAKEITGRKVYQSVTDIEDQIDLAVVTIPADKIMDLIPELEKKKTKGMLLITSGFKEVGAEGSLLEEKITQMAYEAGILILGPNTMGVCNPHYDFYCTASHAYPVPGSTALVCQSGNMGTQLLAFAEQQDIGIRAFSGSGNEAMVTIEDYMEAFEIDELTRTVVLYLESVKDGERFYKSAARVSKQKPVVVLKGGRTKMGEKAAASHTGAMASDTKVFEAACRQAGIIQVSQPMELLDLSAVFSSLPKPKGNRVAIMTLGGGWGVITADLCAEHGLEVPQLSEDIIKKLDTLLPSFWSRGNPVDIVGEGDPDIPKICMEELMKWDGCDAVIHLGIQGKRILVNNLVHSIEKTDPSVPEDKIQFFMDYALKLEEDYIEHVIQLTKKYEKPVLGVSLLTDEISRTLYRQENNDYKGVFFPSPERAVKALWGMCQYQDWKKKNGNDCLKHN